MQRRSTKVQAGKSDEKQRGASVKGRAGSGSSRARVVLALVKWGLVLLLFGGAVGALGLTGMLWYYGADRDLPSITSLSDYRPLQITRVLARGGEVVGELFEERRTFVPLERIAPAMQQAVVDAEDANFREHEGIDFVGLLRAVWVNVRAGRTKQGASTITQQVVKTFLLSPERTLRRKMQEVILARRIESALTKDEILTLYLNQIYFGHGRYGVEEAARHFFGKHAADLDVGEAALLAGIPQSPERLSPHCDGDAAKRRQTYVLRRMVENGHLSAVDAQRWIDQPIRVIAAADEHLGAAPEIVDLVRRELARRFGADELARLGLEVRTTIDVQLQDAARDALERELRALDGRHEHGAAIAQVAAGKVKAKLAALAKALPKSGPRSGVSYEAVVIELSAEREEAVVDLGGWRGAVVLGDPRHRRAVADWEHKRARCPSQSRPEPRGVGVDRYAPESDKGASAATGARFRAGDVLRVRLAPELGKPTSPGVRAALALDHGPQGAFVAIDPETRHVLALIGGYGFIEGQFDRALLAKRQPGSSFKPFVYAAALASGRFTPATIVNDAPEVYDLWKPQNFEKETYRGPVRLREALARSINTVAIRVLADVGVEAVVALAARMGIRSTLPTTLSLALGSGEVTPIELVNAYATFATGGLVAQPVFLTRVGDAVEPVAPAERALSPEAAYLATSLMESVVQDGTAGAAKKLRRRVAGKTGTTDGARDAWFVGFSPDLVAGAWIGFDDVRRLGKGEAGGRSALPVWIAFMREALARRGHKTFFTPPGIVTARIDVKTGKLAAPGVEEGVIDEVFLAGTEPTEVAPAPGEVDPATFVLDQMDDVAGAPPDAGPTVTPPLAPAGR